MIPMAREMMAPMRASRTIQKIAPMPPAAMVPIAAMAAPPVKYPANSVQLIWRLGEFCCADA